MDCPDTDGSAVGDLPVDPLVEILTRLPARSICRFKCVSKAWLGLITDPLHRKRLPQTLAGFFFYEDTEEISGGDGDNLPSQGNRRFVDPLGKPVRLLDPSFSFLTKLPGIANIRLLHSCNGLFLFGHGPDTYDPLGYIVCNPATEQWVAVPSSDWTSSVLAEEEEEGDDNDEDEVLCTYLMFDPAVSSHFHLLLFVPTAGVHTYSSETGMWVDRAAEQRQLEDGAERQQLGTLGGISTQLGSAFVSGMLYLVVYRMQIAAVDVQGKTRKLMFWPEKPGRHWSDGAFIGKSQGRLHCITENQECNFFEIMIWVLEDYDKEEWVLKHSVSSSQLVGKTIYHVQYHYYVVAIHPDHNLVFIVDLWDRKLISYHMDSN